MGLIHYCGRFSKPSHIVSADCLFEKSEMPIEASVYEERCALFERLIGVFGVANAIFVLAINDVLYRYCVGWSAPYSESDIQAQDIALKLKAEAKGCASGKRYYPSCL